MSLDSTYKVPLGMSMKDRFCPLNVDSVVPGNWFTAIFGTGMTLTSGKGEGELALLVTTSTGCKTVDQIMSIVAKKKPANVFVICERKAACQPI